MPTSRNRFAHKCDVCSKEFGSWPEAVTCEEEHEKPEEEAENEEPDPENDVDEKVQETVEALCEIIERREDYPFSRSRTPGTAQVRLWLGKYDEEPFLEEEVPQIERWARGDEILPERRIGIHLETIFPPPLGIFVRTGR